MAKKKIVITNNREIYKKFNLLNFTNEVVINNASDFQIDRILKSINKDRESLIKEKIGEYILIRKKAPANFSIYFRPK